MVHFEGDDVLVLGHGPVGSEGALLAIVDRRLAPEAAEIGLPDVLLVEFGIADVDLVERRREGERGVIDSVRGAGEIARDHGHCLAPPEIACRDA